MPYASLRDFIARLEGAGRLVRVATPVSPHLEMTEIQTRLLAEQGPAVLFENVVRRDGGRYAMPVLVNLFGTVERVAWGMDRESHQLREIGETLAFLKQPEPPGGWREALEMLPLLKTVLAMKPKTVASAPCQDVVLTGADIDLTQLPIQTCWPGEPAPLVTWPLVVTKGPSDRREDNASPRLLHGFGPLAEPVWPGRHQSPERDPNWPGLLPEQLEVVLRNQLLGPALNHLVVA